MTDWFPTLFSAAGGDVATLDDDLDGIDLWDDLVNLMPSRRMEMLYNIAPEPVFINGPGAALRLKFINNTKK